MTKRRSSNPLAFIILQMICFKDQITSNYIFIKFKSNPFSFLNVFFIITNLACNDQYQ